MMDLTNTYVLMEKENNSKKELVERYEKRRCYDC